MKNYCYYYSLSSLLANATSNSTYLDSAYLSFEFTYSHLYNPSTGLVGNLLQANSCSTPQAGAMYDTAYFLEGVAILGATTGNTTLQNL
jgi:hypothetical protein